MHNVIANLYECLHCKGEGTCRNAENGASCAACIKRNELKGTSYTGLICQSCGGIGKADPMTERIDKRAAPLLALGTVFGLLIIVATSAFISSPHFSQIIAFAGAIIGSIIGFYFSGKQIKN
jgi:hypothetical protein